jgi:DNA modification methylase
VTPYYADDWLTVYGGDCREVMRSMEPESVHCVVTSPPYWGLRDYGDAGQLGLEPTPEEYVANMVEVFREVRRVLRSDGTVWLNLGDSYNSGSQDNHGKGGTMERPGLAPVDGWAGHRPLTPGLKPKDLVGIPWRVAFALQQPYYTGAIKDEKDRIWLAAMVDAEGCMFLHKRGEGLSNGQGYTRKNATYGAGLEVSNTSEAIVQRCLAIAGKGSIVRQEKDRRQPLYRWNLRSNECRELIRELYPYLVAKQHQARLLIGCPSSGPDAEKAWAGLQSLHHGTGSSIDFTAPASMLEPGWYLRSDIVWAKPNPMPESVTDRPTKSHEYLFLLSKSPRYYFDADAVREPSKWVDAEGRPIDSWGRPVKPPLHHEAGRQYSGVGLDPIKGGDGAPRSLGAGVTDGQRNLRSVWTIATQPYPGAHFATFPRKLVEPCIKAGTSERGVCPVCGLPWRRVTEETIDFTSGSGRAGREPDGKNGHDYEQATSGSYDIRMGPSKNVRTLSWIRSCEHDAEPVPATVLDPFAGSGTTGVVAQSLGRRAVLIDLNPDYLAQAMTRNRDIPLGLEVA